MDVAMAPVKLPATRGGVLIGCIGQRGKCQGLFVSLWQIYRMINKNVLFLGKRCY